MINKTSFFILPAVLLASQVNLQAQVYSQTIVGYVNMPFDAGVNLFGNPLDNTGQLPSGMNDLATLFPVSGQASPPNGAQVALWNPATDAFGPSSTFNNGSWSLDLTLLPGTGAELITPTPFNNTFVGYADNHDGTLLTDPNSLPPPPVFSGPNGIYLRSDAAPLKDVGTDIFLNILGRLPNAGEQVTLLDAASQTYTTDTYLGNGAWDNVPTLQVGQAAFFNVGPVPEPSTLFAGLAGLAVVIAGCRRRL